MRRKPGSAILILLLSDLVTQPLTFAQQPSAKFTSSDVLTASDIPYPPNTTTTGLVALALNLASNGQKQNVQVQLDTPPLTAAAQSAVQTWTFKPGSSNGQPVPSLLAVDVVFNPYNPGGTSITGLLLTPPANSGPGNATFVPPQITAATYALYPATSLAQGTVVLSLTIGTSGQVRNVHVVRDVPALTQAATQAVKSWQYNPGTLSGQPIPAKLVVAFVFQRNLS
jgi:TonB family protein